MSIKPRLFLTFSLLAVLLASACTPAETEAPTQPAINIPSATPRVAPQPSVDLTATPSEDTQPVATSRGPNLEATDPKTVSLASGELHFVEFFRFT